MLLRAYALLKQFFMPLIKYSSLIRWIWMALSILFFYVFQAFLSEKVSFLLQRYGLIWKPDRIEGHQRCNRQKIQETLRFCERKYPVFLPLVSLSEKLKQDPWIASVDLKRFWPTGLLLVIQEHQPSVLWRSGDKTYPVTGMGHVIDAPVVSSDFPDLPLLKGEDAPLLFHFFWSMLNNRFPEMIPHIGVLVFTRTHQWHIQLHSGLWILLPQYDWGKALAFFLQSTAMHPYPWWEKEWASLFEHISLRDPKFVRFRLKPEVMPLCRSSLQKQETKR